MVGAEPNVVARAVVGLVFIEVMPVNNIEEAADGTGLGIYPFAPVLYFGNILALGPTGSVLPILTSAQLFVPCESPPAIIGMATIRAGNINISSFLLFFIAVRAPNGRFTIPFDICRLAAIAATTLTNKIAAALSIIHRLIISEWWAVSKPIGTGRLFFCAPGKKKEVQHGTGNQGRRGLRSGCSPGLEGL